MKKINKFVITEILISMIFISYSYAYTAKVNIEATRIRKEMNTSSNIINVIYEDDEVEVLEEDGEWCKIKYKDSTGYVKKEFLDKVKSSNKTELNTVKNEASKDSTVKAENKTQNTTNNKNENVSNNISTNTSNSTKNNNIIENGITNNVNNNVENDTNNNTTNNDPLEEGEIETIKDTNLRTSPSFISKEIKSISQGTSLKKITQINHWIKVSDEENEGWILENDIKSQKASEIVDDVKPEENSDKDNVENTVNNELTNTVKDTKNQNNIINNTVSNTITNTTNNTDEKTVKKENSNNTSSKSGKINVETAKIREKATTESKNTGLLDYGDVVTIVAEEGEFYKITHENESGYVSKKLITVKKTTN